MRPAGPEITAVAPLRRPSIVPSLKLTETERGMLGVTHLPAIDGRAVTATPDGYGVEPSQSTVSPAIPTGGPTASAALEDEDSRLPGAAYDMDDAATPCTPTSASLAASMVVTTAAPAATAAAFAFEPFRGRWHYGQPVLARYRHTPNFYSGNIATYLGAGLFMVVFDDGTLDYRVKREDLLIVCEDEPDASATGVPGKPLPSDEFLSLAPPNIQLMVDFSANPPRQVLLPVDGGYGDQVEDEQDEFYARYPGLCTSEPTVERSSQEVPTAVLGRMRSPILAPSIPDEGIFMKQLENGVAFEEDSTQVSDSDDSDDGDNVDDGGELMTPWQQMTQTFGMAKTLRPRAMRRSSISSVSQVDRVSARLTKQASLNSVLRTPRSFKQMLSDYLSRHSKKVRPSGSQRDLSAGGGVGGVELTQQEWLEQMLTRLDVIQRDGVAPIGFDCMATIPTASSSSIPTGSTASSVTTFRSGHSRAAPTPVTLQSSGSAPPQRVVYERRGDGVRAYGTVKARLASGDLAVVTEDEQMITVQAFAPASLKFLPSAVELARQARGLAHAAKELYAGRRVQVTLYPGSRFSGNGLIVVEKRTTRRPSSSAAPAEGGAQPEPDQPTFHVLLHSRIRLHNVPPDKLIPMTEKPRRQARASITDDQFLICSNKAKVFIGDQVFVKCAGDADGATTEEKVGVLNGVYSNRTAAIDFADGSTGYEVLPHRISKRKKPRYPQGDQDVLSLKNAVLMNARNGTGVGNGSNSSAGSGAGARPARHATSSSGDVDYSAPYDAIEEGFQVLADHPRRATVEKCVVIKTHPSSACDLRFADGTIAFEVFPSQMVLEGGERVQRRRRRRRRSRSHLRHKQSRLGRNGDEMEDDDEEDDRYEWDEWEPRVGEYVLAWSSRFSRFCSAKVNGRAANNANGTGPASASPDVASTGGALFSVAFDYGEQRANMPIERLARLDDADVLLSTQKLTNYSIDTMGFELWPVGFSVGEAVMARVHGSAIYFPGVVEFVYDSAAGNAHAGSNSGSARGRRGSKKGPLAGPRVCGVLFDSGERDPRVPFTSAFTVDPRQRYLHGCGTQASNARGSSSSGNGPRAASHTGPGIVSNGMSIALGLGLGGVGIASNDQLVYQLDADGGNANMAPAVMLPLSVADGAASPTNRVRRASGNGSVSSMIMSMAGSFFGREMHVDDGETHTHRASQLLTEIGARLRRRGSS